MKEIPLTRGYVALVDDECYGHLSQWRWHVQTPRKCCYAARTVNGKKVFMQHAVYQYKTGRTDAPLIDHRDRYGLNNQWSNLRLASSQQNAHNSTRRNKTGYRGVKQKGSRYAAHIRVKSGVEKEYLGTFATAEEAARAYDKTALEHYGEFAVLNFPREDNERNNHRSGSSPLYQTAS
jgi:hypothetical protein